MSDVAMLPSRPLSNCCYFKTSCYARNRNVAQSLYCSLAYSALASLRMGTSGSASFQAAKKS
jgi:hypothetical protein